jgi:hypothetical protein
VRAKGGKHGHPERGAPNDMRGSVQEAAQDATLTNLINRGTQPDKAKELRRWPVHAGPGVSRAAEGDQRATGAP